MPKQLTKKSFTTSRKLPTSRMTVISDISVPAMCGTLHHAIICSLLDNKNRFVTWNKLERLVPIHVLQYGGEEAFKRFTKKCSKSSVLGEIKTCLKKMSLWPACTFNKTAQDLHERGVVLFMFLDGAMAKTGGKCIHRNNKIFVHFKDGLGAQSCDDIISFQQFRRKHNLVGED